MQPFSDDDSLMERVAFFGGGLVTPNRGKKETELRAFDWGLLLLHKTEYGRSSLEWHTVTFRDSSGCT